MNYYRLRLPSDPKVIGVRNGIMQVELDESKYLDKEAYKRIRTYFFGLNWWEKERFPPFDFHFHAQILRGAKLTDFLSFGPSFIGCPFLIHNKVAKVFSQFNMQEHRLFPAILYEKERVVSSDYQLFYTRLLEIDIVDFEKCLFFTGTQTLGKKFHHLNSLEEYKAFTKQNLTGIEIMAMSQKFDRSLDFFYGRLGSINISEGLKEAIEILDFTGIRVIEAYEPKIVI